MGGRTGANAGMGTQLRDGRKGELLSYATLVDKLASDVVSDTRLKCGQIQAAGLGAKIEVFAIVSVGEVLDAGDDQEIFPRQPVPAGVPSGEAASGRFQQTR